LPVVQPARIRRVLGRLRDPATRGGTIRRIRRRLGARLAGGAIESPRGATAGGAGDEGRRHRLEAGLAEAIARGEPLEVAVVGTVAALSETGDWHDWNAAWAIAAGVAGLPGGETASAMGHAVLEHRRRHFDRAWSRLEQLPDATLAAHVPVEAVDGALASGMAAGLERARGIARAVVRAGTEAPPSVVVDLAGRLLAFGEHEAAAALVAELRARPSVDLDAERTRSRQLIEGWLDAGTTAVPPGAVAIGLLGYRTPDRGPTSGNLEDFIETLAFVGNLVRYRTVTFTGGDGLGKLATELQARVRPELRLEGPRGTVHLVPVDRDFSSAGDVPEGTWLVAFGWHMQPLYDLRYDFPYHRHLRPLFVSFHVNRLDMLSDEALAYLRAHAPVGCRDWSTVFLLLSAGIDAFFSGCLTATIDALYPAREAAFRDGGAIGAVDLPPDATDRVGRRGAAYRHRSDAFRSMSLTEGLRAADARLMEYQATLKGAVTESLDAYLPLVSLGVPVEFTSDSPGDVRFAGLTGLQPGGPSLVEMRSGLRRLLEPVLEAILGGADEPAVRALWRDLSQPLVALAKARFEAPVIDQPTTIDVAASVAEARAGSRRSGPTDSIGETITDVVLSFDRNLAWPAAVLIESIVANASRPVRITVLGRGLPEAFQDWLAAAFPSLPLAFVPCDHITYGPRGRPRRVPSRITISTMDRLLLPELMPDVDRVVYLDVDMLMLGDVTELGELDLDGHPIAARDSNVSEASEWQRAGQRLDGSEALELRRRMAQRHGFGHRALNAGALVMDLARMRRDGFTATVLGWIERFGLHDQDAMLAYAGPERRPLDARWNSMPVLEDVRDPKLIHWASFGKPWDANLTYAKERWTAYASRLRHRAGLPPMAERGAAARPGDAP
jgi:lipopolysaccharide biosynthesis glycosyltransferase